METNQIWNKDGFDGVLFLIGDVGHSIRNSLLKKPIFHISILVKSGGAPIKSTIFFCCLSMLNLSVDKFNKSNSNILKLESTYDFEGKNKFILFRLEYTKTCKKIGLLSNVKIAIDDLFIGGIDWGNEIIISFLKRENRYSK